ncbi:MAG: HYR domain-containing protein [Bacteroidetes bacterium]|nr:MAG: HYR domain-containing protein [Bacteroidota bacterium]
MVKGNGFAPRRMLWLTLRHAPLQFGWFMFMAVTVSQKTVVARLCGQTAFAGKPGNRMRMKQNRINTHLFPLVFLLTMMAALFTGPQAGAQCALACKGSVTVPLDSNGMATIYPSTILQSSVGCSNNFEITVVDTLGNEYGPQLADSLMNQPLTATILHPASGNSCSTIITLVDNTPPQITCGPDTLFIWCNTPLDSLETPVVSDNVTDTADIQLTWADSIVSLGCQDSVGLVPATGYITRSWYAEDESGNVDSCTQVFVLKRATVDMVVFPPHHDGVEAPALECSVDDPLDLSVTGQPMLEGYIIDNTTSCDLLISHSDQSLPICGGAKKYIRTWTVFDFCTEDFRVYSQVIKVLDTTAPDLTCPDNLSVTSFSSACSAQVFLPSANAEDGCSGVTVEPSWEFGNGFGPFDGVPVGSHTVTYKATDGCNNSSTCTMTVTVKDEKKPTALCENLVTASLEEDGTILIYATSFDNGSYDNCGIAELLVSTADQPFDTFVSFDCEDLNSNTEVTLKVIDVNGLESTCISSAKVLDEIAPEIQCPANKTINCGVNYNNPVNTGFPYATDNCTVASTTFTNQTNLNTCGLGTITRTWTAKDQSNNSSSCQQIITIEDNTPIDVVFPEDLVYYKCQPDTDPAVTGEPIVTGADCEQLQITHTDYLFYTAEPSCYKLIRNWAIINWCVYTPNDPNNTGFWEHTQVIEVRDTLAPVMTCPPAMTANIQGTACEAFVELPMPDIQDCSAQITLVNDSPFANSLDGVANGVYPQGTHTITYTAFDGCGNTSTCSMQLTVKDAQAPNPVCNNGVSVTIQTSGYVTLTPTMINNGSYDNCTPQNQLVLQVSPNTFDCQTLGSKKVTLTVTDQSGNSAFCETTVNVQDNFNVCNGQSTVTIAGKLETENGTPLSNKIVGLTGGINIAVHTDQDGTFDFPNLPPGQSYTVKPEFDKNHTNGVTTFDLVIIRRHILNVELLDSPYKLIAADVNNSKAVTTLDLVELQKLILHVSEKMPNNKSWRFVAADYVFPNPQNPWMEPFPESFSYPNLETNKWNQNFVGIKIGDVNGSANGGSFNEDETDDRNFTDNLTFTTEDIELEAGVEYAIPFVAPHTFPLAGFQFTFEFDPTALQWLGAESGFSGFDPAANMGTTRVTDGLITVSWVNTDGFELPREGALFSLRFRSLRNGRLSEMISIGSDVIPAEAIAGRIAEANTTLEPMGVALSFNTAQVPQLHLYQNTPNPFRNQTTVRFSLPEDAPVSLTVYNAYGQVVKALEGQFTEGEHEVVLDFNGDKVTGMLFCRLTVPGYDSQVIRMVADGS